LLTSHLAILTDVVGTALGTFHQIVPQFIALLCNA
jgi:hypothetical protein